MPDKITPKIDYRSLDISYMRFGNVDSDDLFCEKEQELFRFYEKNRDRYKLVADIGANIGVHTILMARNGWKVMAYEPYKKHFEALFRNLKNNNIRCKRFNKGKIDDHITGDVQAFRQAVSTSDGETDFVIVYGNTTGSHISGDKNPYGPTYKIKVKTIDCRRIFKEVDFCKIDCEGHEAKILSTVEKDDKCEFMIEVGNTENAKIIYHHFRGWKKMWSQQSEWNEVKRLEEMPSHHSHGALFIGDKPPIL